LGTVERMLRNAVVVVAAAVAAGIWNEEEAEASETVESPGKVGD
jgi:hypothetical protein